MSFAAEQIPLERQAGQIWLLLNVYPTEPLLRTWALWYFAQHRRYEDLEALLNNTPQSQMLAGPAGGAAFYAGIITITKGGGGSVSDAENAVWDAGAKSLEAVPTGYYYGAATANLGLLAQARLSFTRALELYAKALSGSRIVPGGPVYAGGAGPCLSAAEACRAALRAGLVLRATGHEAEALKYFERAHSLNPDDVRVWSALSAQAIRQEQ
jgi:tetratricopeptide (TPR) repeat protein